MLSSKRIKVSFAVSHKSLFGLCTTQPHCLKTFHNDTVCQADDDPHMLFDSQCAPGPPAVDLGALPDESLPQPARLARQVALPHARDRPGEGNDVAPECRLEFRTVDSIQIILIK